MFLFKRKPAGKADPAAKADPAQMSEESLIRKARKNMVLIAALGTAIIVADLLLSVTGQSVAIQREHGKLFLLRPAAGEPAGHIGLDAAVQDGSERIRQHYDIRLDPERTEGGDAKEEESPSAESSQSPSSQELIRSQLRSLTAGINEDRTRRKVPLPETLDSGQAIRWTRSRTGNTLLLATLTLILMILTYRNRLQPIRKRQELQRRSVLRQLPTFINELVLLLGAGLVLSRAFEVVVKQSMSGQAGEEGNSDYFTSNIRSIYRSVKTTNAGLHEDLQRFAQDSGVSELMRVSGIISDNINKGAELTRKLERESEQLWLSRRLQAEEQGRLAETKMTFPLAIFLCVLIIITVSPALLQL